MHEYPQLQARYKAHALSNFTIPRKIAALDALQQSFAEPTSPFNSSALDNALRPASALSPPQKKRKWENSQDEAEQDMNKALAHLEKVHRIIEEHAEGLWTTVMELHAAHVLLDETDEEEGEDDETTIITTFVHGLHERLKTFDNVIARAVKFLQRPLLYLQERTVYNQRLLRTPELHEHVYALRQFDRLSLLTCRQDVLSILSLYSDLLAVIRKE